MGVLSVGGSDAVCVDSAFLCGTGVRVCGLRVFYVPAVCAGHVRVAGRPRAAAGRRMTARGPGAPAAAAPPPRAARAPRATHLPPRRTSVMADYTGSVDVASAGAKN